MGYENCNEKIIIIMTKSHLKTKTKKTYIFKFLKQTITILSKVHEKYIKQNYSLCY